MMNLNMNIHVPLKSDADIVVREGSYCNFVLFSNHELLLDCPYIREDLPLAPFIFTGLKRRDNGKHKAYYLHPTAMFHYTDDNGDTYSELEYVTHLLDYGKLSKFNSYDPRNAYKDECTCIASAIVFNKEVVENLTGIYPLFHLFKHKLV